MSGEQKKATWIREHLSYEFSMLKFAFNNLNGLEKRQIYWNVFYGSFFVNFRNIATFLKNDETRTSDNYRALDYCENFKLDKKETDEIRGLLPRIEAQIMHMGKRRGAISHQIDVEDIRKAFAWSDRNLQGFMNGLPAIYRNAWKEGQFEDLPDEVTIQVGLKGPPSSSSHPSMHLSITAPITQKRQ